MTTTEKALAATKKEFTVLLANLGGAAEVPIDNVMNELASEDLGLYWDGKQWATTWSAAADYVQRKIRERLADLDRDDEFASYHAAYVNAEREYVEGQVAKARPRWIRSHPAMRTMMAPDGAQTGEVLAGAEHGHTMAFRAHLQEAREEASATYERKHLRLERAAWEKANPK